jgi:hypothetical protein
MGGASSACKKNAHIHFGRKCDGRTHFEDLSVDIRVTFKLSSRKKKL